MYTFPPSGESGYFLMQFATLPVLELRTAGRRWHLHWRGVGSHPTGRALRWSYGLVCCAGPRIYRRRDELDPVGRFRGGSVGISYALDKRLIIVLDLA